MLANQKNTVAGKPDSRANLKIEANLKRNSNRSSPMVTPRTTIIKKTMNDETSKMLQDAQHELQQL